MGWGSGKTSKCPYCKNKKVKKNLGHCDSWGCKSKAAASGMKSIHEIPNGVADHGPHRPCGCSKSMSDAYHAQHCPKKK